MNPQIIKGLNSLPLTFVGFFQKEPPYGWFLTYNDLTHDFRLNLQWCESDTHAVENVL